MKKQFHIPDPCHKNWETMQPVSGGRFCDLCSKKVHDLTDKTDDEIRLLLNSNEKICVKVQTQRLRFLENRNTQHHFFNFPFRKAASGIFIAAMFTSALKAQAKKDTLQTVEIGEVIYTAYSVSNDDPDRQFYRPKNKWIRPVITGNKEISSLYSKISIITLSEKYPVRGIASVPEDDISFNNIYVFEEPEGSYGNPKQNVLFLSANSHRMKDDEKLDLNIDRARKIEFNPKQKASLYFLDGEEITQEEYENNKNNPDFESYFLSEFYAEELLGKDSHLQNGIILSYKKSR